MLTARIILNEVTVLNHLKQRLVRGERPVDAGCFCWGDGTVES